MKQLKDYVREIPNFPQPGVIFRDLTTVLEDADGFRLAIDQLQNMIKDLEYDAIAAAESRGFILAAPLAYNNHKPLIVIRKKGKLPAEVASMDYDLEYGTATLEVHKDSIKPGQRILLVDDLIATGGTTMAMIKLVELLGGKVADVLVLMELAGLKGREKLQGYRLDAAITYEGK